MGRYGTTSPKNGLSAFDGSRSRAGSRNSTSHVEGSGTDRMPLLASPTPHRIDAFMLCGVTSTQPDVLQTASSHFASSHRAPDGSCTYISTVARPASIGGMTMSATRTE